VKAEVLHKTHTVEIDCADVWRLFVEYTECDLPLELRSKLEEHLQECRHCAAVYDGARNVMLLLGKDTLVELPQGFSERLYKRLSLRM